jgi:uncharacterized protein (DUF2141 family)
MKKNIFLACFILVSCASIKYPEGGPKDEEPPIIRSVSPNLPQTQFQSRKIVLKFNEFIKNQDYTKEIHFSPPLPTPPKVLNYSKKIKIVLPKNLRNDCTYLMTVTNIKDYNEGNTLKEIKEFPFTKSNQFDTCSIYGVLIKSHPNLNLNKFKVFLYEMDSVPYQNFENKTPTYFSFVNEQQEYKIKCIKAGKYKILAVDDKNDDFKYNDGENVGIDTDLTIDLNEESKVEWDLIAIPNDKKSPKIKKSYWKDSLNYSVEFTEPILKDSLKIKSDYPLKTVHNEQKLEIYFSSPIKDTISVQLSTLLDTLGNATDTTIKIALNKTASPGKFFQLQPPEITPSYWIIKANTILNESEKSKIQVLDSLNNIINLPIEIYQNEIKINVNQSSLDTAQMYKIIIDSTFKSYQNQKLDSTIQFTVKLKMENDYYCYLKVSIDCNYPNFLAYLKNVNTKEIIKFQSKEQIFDKLKAGKYQIVIIDDEDKNGLWSPGNFKSLKLPEPIFIYSQEIELKPKMKIENLKIQVNN